MCSQPVAECAAIGHPMDESSEVPPRVSPEFSSYLASMEARSGIRLEVVANDRYSSVRRHGFPGDLATAGDWNAIAARNHRVEYDLVPADS